MKRFHDETIESHLLFRKFKYLTSELQLFLQTIPLLFKCPLDIVGTINNPETQLIEIKGEILKYANDGLKDNQQIVLEAVKQDGDLLTYASNRLKDNDEIVLVAVKQNGNALYYASDRLKDNDQIVMEGVKQNVKALLYASKRLKDNYNIVLEAVKQNIKALEYASRRLRSDLTIIKEISNSHQCLNVFQYFGDELRNIEYIHNAIQNNHSLRNNYKKKNHQ